MSEAQSTTQNNWFYEENGQRKGPVSENEMVQFIKSSVISHGTSVWKQGFPDWLKVENTDLRVHLDNSAPPPLSGEHINSTLVWVLAFAPLRKTCKTLRNVWYMSACNGILTGHEAKQP